MREILFRGKRVDNGEWVEGFYTENSITYFSGTPVITNNVDDYRVERNTVGQYIGLKDKNDKKIFEGDIIDISGTDWGELSSSNHVPVEWCHQISGFDPFANYDSDCGIFTEAFKCEIVGNIHDNPELLEVN